MEIVSFSAFYFTLTVIPFAFILIKLKLFEMMTSLLIGVSLKKKTFQEIMTSLFIKSL